MTSTALDPQFLADSAATFNFRLGLPVPLAITPDGAVLFRRTPARAFAADLFELTPQGSVKTLATAADLLGASHELLSDAEKARRERTRTATKGVVDIDVSEDGLTVLVPLGGKFFLIDRASGQQSVVDPGGAAYDPRLAPDGKTIAFVRDGDLWTLGLTGPAKQWTRHGDGEEYGIADFAAQEEFARMRGFWWSRDSTSLAFQCTNNTPVDTLYVSDARHPDRPPVPFKYPRAGTANAIVKLGVLTLVAGAEPRWFEWDAKYAYLVAVAWPARGPLTAMVLNRDQTDVLLLTVQDPQHVHTPMRTLLAEHDDAWLNLDVGAPLWLEDGSGFLWLTEHTGSWVLELHDHEGKLLRVLTKPEFGLRKLAGITDTAAIVEASTSPPRQEVWRVPFDGSAPSQLATGEGFASALRVAHNVVVIDTLIHAGGRKTVAIRAEAVFELPSAAEQPSLVPSTVLESVEIDGRTQHVAITRPRAFDSASTYPVLLKVYAGPHAVMVIDARDSYVMDQWYADAGFVVVRCDGRGTPNRGRAWERAILHDLITVPLADQAAALRALGARHRELDLDRVGVFGWSFGGYFAIMAVLLCPDLFKAAVAGAPVSDWALYDTAYTERYMKTPQQNPEGYRRASALTHAAKLSRPLLLIHGISDDNVHFAHTLALIEALYVAAKRAEVITLSSTHMLPDPALNFAREQVQIDFFREHLALPDPARAALGGT